MYFDAWLQVAQTERSSFQEVREKLSLVQAISFAFEIEEFTVYRSRNRWSRSNKHRGSESATRGEAQLVWRAARPRS